MARGLPLRHRTSIFLSDIENLEKQQADILIAHEAPKPHPSGFSVLNQLAKKMGVKKIFHGHHHENYLYKNRKNHIQIYNVGYRSLAMVSGEYLLKNKDERK